VGEASHRPYGEFFISLGKCRLLSHCMGEEAGGEGLLEVIPQTLVLHFVVELDFGTFDAVAEQTWAAIR